MATTTNFNFPLLEASQAQKEVTINEAITQIDAQLNNGSGSGVVRPKKVVTIGDSITANGVTATADSVYLRQRGFMSWLQIRLGFPFTYNIGFDGTDKIGHDVSISGDGTANMASRFAADVIAKNPDIIIIEGGTNDITGGETAPTIIANVKSMIDAGVASGALVAIFTILPRSDINDRVHGLSDVNWSADGRKIHHAVNRWIRDYAHATNNVILLDPYARLLDPSSADGNASDAVSYDGLHPTPEGAYLMADVAVEALKDVVSPPQRLNVSKTDIYDATHNVYGSILTNGYFDGTGGTASTGASGDIPDNFLLERFTGSVISASCSKVARTDDIPGEQFQMIVSCDGTGSGLGEFRFRANPFTMTTVTADEWYEASVEIEVSASTNGTQPLHAAYLMIRDVSSGGYIVRCLNIPYEYTAPSPDVHAPLPDVAWKGVLKTPPIQAQGTSGLRFSVHVEMDEAKNDSVTIKLANASMRRLEGAPNFN